MILATGIFLTIRLKGIQVRKLILAFKYMFSNETDGEHGEISSFGALCTALSATIGTGNIVGVATAIVAGGPGALFWMIVAATVGTATKYSECLLAIKYRTVADDGHIVGGPFYYIEKGMGENWKWLAKIFAVFGVMVGLLGIGTFSQINGITSAVNNFFDANNAWTVQLFGRDYCRNYFNNFCCFRYYWRSSKNFCCSTGCCSIYGCRLHYCRCCNFNP